MQCWTQDSHHDQNELIVLVLLELVKGLGISWWIPKPLFYLFYSPA